MPEQLTHIGDAGVAVALIICLTVWAIVVQKLWSKALDVSRENNAARNANEARHVENEEKQGDLLQKTTLELVRVSDVLTLLAERLETGNGRTVIIQSALDNAVSAMRQTADSHGVLLRDLPKEVRRTLQDDFEQLKKDIPAAVETALQKHTRELWAIYEAQSAAMTARIEALSQEIPTRTTQLLQANMAEMQKTVKLLFAAVAGKPIDADAEPPESSEETKTDG